jgi:tRNA(Arg) A34 adenosine deaminase TadA
MNPTRYLEVASDISRSRRGEKTSGKYPLGSVGIRPDGLVVSSFNVVTEPHRCPSGHAEHRLASKLQPGSVVFVARTDKNGDWALARPCVHCETRLRNARVSRVYYTIRPNEYGVMKF